MLAAALAGAVPFALYDARGITPLLLLFEGCLCLLWVMYSCRTSIAATLTGLIAGDLLNQAFIVPFANLKAFFTRPFARFAGSRRRWLPVLLALVGVVVSVPLLGAVIFLLASSDDGFKSLLDTLAASLSFPRLTRYAFELVFGVPIAAYLFGAVAGNALRVHTAHISADGVRCAITASHALPRAVLYTPLALFVTLYLVYFIAMGSYLFSGLSGELPVVYTYAEYARRGFFELCAVATINLIILGGIWLFARRGEREYPLPLRILCGLLALLTCLLIVTAISKMMLYIQTYALTELRVYTLWFMVLMLLVFLVLAAWHARPFNAARPAIALVLVFTLGLGLANTSGIIANYNVDRYLAGKTELLDVQHLDSLGAAAVPALRELAQHAKDPAMRQEAQRVLAAKQGAEAAVADGGGAVTGAASDTQENLGAQTPWPKATFLKQMG
jgi:hypothetical protein